MASDFKPTKATFLSITLVDGYGHGRVGAPLPHSFQLPRNSQVVYFADSENGSEVLNSTEPEVMDPWETLAPTTYPTNPPAQDVPTLPASIPTYGVPEILPAQHVSTFEANSQTQSVSFAPAFQRDVALPLLSDQRYIGSALAMAVPLSLPGRHVSTSEANPPTQPATFVPAFQREVALPLLSEQAYTEAELARAFWTGDKVTAVRQAAHSFIIGQHRPSVSAMAFHDSGGYQKAMYEVAHLANAICGHSIRDCQAELWCHDDLVEKCRARWAFWKENQHIY
jgi:hypothetical protein